MIKTLRITSVIAVIAAILATAFFLFPAVFAVGNDEEMEQFLHSPGAIKKFKLNMTNGDKAKGSKSQIPPLVKQAKAFALYLNPPPKPKPRRTARKTAHKRTAATRPAKVSAKFKLIGTSYYASHPDLSLALIDEPGKGLRWVRQSGQVGHLVIEQVKDGLVVVKDGKRTFEEPVVERPKEKNLLKTKNLSPDRAESKPTPVAADRKALAKREPGKKPGRKARASIPTTRAPQRSPKEVALMEKLVAELKTAQKGSKPDKIGLGPGDSDEENAALIEKYLSDLEAMRVGAEEARKLDRLGKKLKGARQGANRAKTRGDKIEPSSREPNSTEKE